MKNLFKFAYALIGLMFISTLSFSSPPEKKDLSKTFYSHVEGTQVVDAILTTSSTISDYAKNNLAKNFGDIINNVVYFNPSVIYLEPVNDPKPDNTVINGILTEQRQSRYLYLQWTS